tara:strand:+ start:148 stop:684 length:537 start_codon:yes stop_codon:yes gene_type:complete
MKNNETDSPFNKVVTGKDKKYKMGKAKGKTKKTYITDIDENEKDPDLVVLASKTTKYRRDGSKKWEDSYTRDDDQSMANIEQYEKEKQNIAEEGKKPEAKKKGPLEKRNDYMRMEGMVNTIGKMQGDMSPDSNSFYAESNPVQKQESPGPKIGEKLKKWNENRKSKGLFGQKKIKAKF